MGSKTLFRSFASGEIAPELFGRIDLTKFQTGLATCLNFITLPSGPAQNRAGFAYVIEVKDSTKQVRLIPFSFNTTQTFVLEFGDNYIRFHTQGGTLLEANKNITNVSQPAGLVTIAAHGYTNGQWVYLDSIGGTVELNGRFFVVSDAAANTFRLKDFAGNYVTTESYGAYTAGGTAGRVYEIASTYAEADLFDLHYTQSADVLTIVHPSYAPQELRRLSATSWSLTSISFVPTIATPAQPGLASGGPGGGTPVTVTYVSTAVAANTLEESLASPINTANYDLTVAGNYLAVTPAVVAGAVRYNVYKLISGLYGYIGQTSGAAVRDNNITPDVSRTPPLANNPFSGADLYPAAVSYFEGRRCFAGTNTNPQSFYATASGTESNMTYSIPTQDDDSIQLRLVAQQVNVIRHIVPLGVLVMLTSGGEWKIAPQNSDVLTPTTAAGKQESNEGANNVVPIITGKSVLYVQESGTRVRELKYNSDSINSSSLFNSNDICVMSPHLFDDTIIDDAAYSKAPVKIGWFVRSDGALLGCTYVPEHEVIAWHQHHTIGYFETCAAVKEGTEYPLYVVVRRVINGRTVRYIERQASRLYTNQEDAVFVDAAISYFGVPNDTFLGLQHLEGQTVSVLADGAVHPQRVVTDGSITLDYEASVVTIGIPITADFKTLPLSSETKEAFAQGTTKNVDELWLRVNESSSIYAGPSFDRMRLYPARTNENYDTPPRLKSDEIHIVIDPKWAQSGQVCVRQTDPLPLTICSMTLKVSFGG